LHYFLNFLLSFLILLSMGSEVALAWRSEVDVQFPMTAAGCDLTGWGV
jgi:hypothetical protein